MSQSYFTPAPNDAYRTCVLGRRIAAFAIDCFICSAMCWGAAIFILLFGVLTFGLGLLMFHILPWIPLLYFTGFIGGTGATPGQRLCGISLRQEENLARPTMAQALVFTLLLWASFAFAGLPLLLALAGPRHRAAHDVLSGLVAVRLPPAGY